jgi:hypothetical protein
MIALSFFAKDTSAVNLHFANNAMRFSQGGGMSGEKSLENRQNFNFLWGTRSALQR